MRGKFDPADIAVCLGDELKSRLEIIANSKDRKFIMGVAKLSWRKRQRTWRRIAFYCLRQFLLSIDEGETFLSIAAEEKTRTSFSLIKKNIIIIIKVKKRTKG